MKISEDSIFQTLSQIKKQKNNRFRNQHSKSIHCQK